MVLIDFGAMLNFVRAVLVQAVQAITINAEPICVFLEINLRCLLSVSLEEFFNNLQVKMGQQDLMCF